MDMPILKISTSDIYYITLLALFSNSLSHVCYQRVSNSPPFREVVNTIITYQKQKKTPLGASGRMMKGG